MSTEQRSSTGSRSILHDIMLAVALFLAGIAVTTMQNIGSQTTEIKVHLATIAQRILEHERRITTLEDRTEKDQGR